MSALANTIFHHALRINNEKCIGCTHCVRSCPTGALYISNGKANLFHERCVDCGECLRRCPVSAIDVEDDDFSNIFRFNRRVVLVPAIFFSQFQPLVSEKYIYSLLHQAGFTDVFEVEQTVEYINKTTKRCLSENAYPKPNISPFCPAIVRLIQVRFPALVNHILPVKSPMEVSAQFYRNQMIQQGVDPADIGIFYITPCAAKIAAVKSPVGETTQIIDGVINMNSLYNIVRKLISNNDKQSCQISDNDPFSLSSKSVLWSLTQGESSNYDGRCLAIDEIHNVIEFLEKVENDEFKDLDFLELRACDQSCAGGVLTTENRFLAAEKLNLRAHQAVYHPQIINDSQQKIFADSAFLDSSSFTGPIPPRSIMKFDDDYQAAMKKLSDFQLLMNRLPMVDCGMCGFQSCHSFAEQVIRNNNKNIRCTFDLIGHINSDNSSNELKSSTTAVWGIDKFNISSNENS